MKLYSFIIISLIPFIRGVHSAPGIEQYFDRTPGHNITIREGDSLTLPCKVSNLQGSCVWSHNGVAVWTNNPRDGDCSFQIKQVSLEKHDGSWQCQVTPPLEGGGKPLASKPITITILVPPEKPQIERSPKYASKMAITANSSETITCNVYRGNPPPTIGWFLNDRNITDKAITRTTQPPGSDKKDILTISELSANFAQEHNNQTLTCLAYHQLGSYSDSVTIQVLYVPILSVSRSVYSVKEGSPLTIECKVDSNPPALVFWKGPNGQTVNTQERNVLHFSDVKREMNGAVYECNAQNEKGLARPVMVRIDVHYTPSSINYSSDQSVEVGRSTKLYCHFDGNPKPEIHWYQIDLRTGIHHEIGMTSEVLNILNATYSREGEYYCKAINTIGGFLNEVRTPPMYLDVFGVPAFPNPEPMVVEGPRGQESRLVMDFCSDPTPTKVYWNYGSIQLDVKSVDYSPEALTIGNRSAFRHRINPLKMVEPKRERASYFKCYEASLEIKDTDSTDEREYTLYVQNEKGISSRILRLRVVSPISTGLVVLTALAIIFATILLSFLVMMFLKCRQTKKSSVVDEEAKEDAQVLSQAIETNNEPIKTKPPEKTNSENYELVYANLDFRSSDPVRPNHPPPTKPKPLMQARSNLRSGISNSSTTEYAKLSFSNKAGL